MPKVSIIYTTYIQTPFQAHMSMATLANIRRYTEGDYELIVMSDSEKFPIRDEYDVLKIDRYEKTEGKSYTQSMNMGAKIAQGEYLVFIQNDVFVWEGWLENLCYYLDNNLSDCVIPDQCPRDREFVKKSYNMTMEEGMQYGSRDEGLLIIRRDAFEKAGGFNEDLTLLHMRSFYDRMNGAGVRVNDTCKVMISHIMAGTNLTRLHDNPEEYNKMMEKDAKQLNI